jgi:hypothetical protein
MNQEVTDKVVLSRYGEVCRTLSNWHYEKYGTTLDREDLTLDQWMNPSA